jgi:predicted phage terminase large subunit-like protein
MQRFERTDLPINHKRRFPRPKSLTFIPARLEDNPILEDNDPDYRANLEALPDVERERLLGGNWNAERVGSEWPPEYFKNIMWPHEWTSEFDCQVAYLDPSKGKTDRSDYSAFVSLGIRGGFLWVEADIKRRPAEQMIKDGFDFATGKNLTAFGVEANAFQDLLLPLFNHHTTELNVMPLPLVPRHNSINKQVRISSLGTYLQQGLVRIRDNEGGRILLRQLKDFPDGVHDDGPDAMEGAFHLMRDVNRLRRQAVVEANEEVETVTFG